MHAMAAAGGTHRMSKRKRKGKPAPLERDRNGVEVATNGDDRGPPERWQHMPYLDDKSDKGGPTVRRMLDPSPLDHYRRRGMIDGRQWIAGDRMRQAWLLAGIEPRVVADLTSVHAGSGPTILVDAKKDAMMGYLTAARAVGAEFAHVLLHVCCMEGTASDWAAQKGQRGRYAEQSGMLVLRLALDALARHYGIRA